jgi:tetratricopeptide (TPR) repeat protein
MPCDAREAMMKQDGKPALNLSICSILKNEAANLPDLIECLPLSRLEWIVVDTGSQDESVELLRHAGVTPHFFKWTDDFSQARNTSLNLATRDWILWLDGDDRVEESFWKSLEPLLQGPKQAYRFVVRSPRENAHGDRFLQIRLFPNHLGICFEGRIHEQLGTSLSKLGLNAQPTDLEILHIGYDTLLKRQSKLARNRALLELERKAFPNDSAVTMEYGNCLFQSADYLEAKATYLTLLPSPDPGACRQIPLDEIVRHFPSLLGECCVKLSEKGEAAEWFQLATRWNPTDIQPFYWLGKSALEAKNITSALEFFYAAVERPAAIGLVATDSYTVRRNALALVVLCEIQLFGYKKAPRTRACLLELIAGGLNRFPLDYDLPLEYLSKAGYPAEAEHYLKKYLELFPQDLARWEDYLEYVLTAGRHTEILEVFRAQSNLKMATGVLEAFRLKSLVASGLDIQKVYAAYLTALRTFSDDPTLLVYFSEFVNHNKLYERCYTDLKSWPRLSAPMAEFLRQLESQASGREKLTR